MPLYTFIQGDNICVSQALLNVSTKSNSRQMFWNSIAVMVTQLYNNTAKNHWILC